MIIFVITIICRFRIIFLKCFSGFKPKSDPCERASESGLDPLTPQPTPSSVLPKHLLQLFSFFDYPRLRNSAKASGSQATPNGCEIRQFERAGTSRLRKGRQSRRALQVLPAAHGPPLIPSIAAGVGGACAAIEPALTGCASPWDPPGGDRRSRIGHPPSKSSAPRLVQEEGRGPCGT